MITNKKKSLIFVTYQYPYLSGEYFIEEEIKYLAEAFNGVAVLPARCFFWKPDLGVRELPEGAVLWDPRKVPLLKRMTWAILACLQAPAYIKRQKVGWQGNAELLTVSYLKAFKSSFKAIFVGHAISWFNRRSNLSGDRIGYAYWRDFSAAALAFSRDALQLKKIYARCHRVDIYSPLRWPNETMIHAQADGVFPVSTDGKCFLEESKGLPGNTIEVHRLGVSIPGKCSAGSDDGVYRVVSCSNCVPVKRVELIAQVLAALPFRVEWTHIGDGPGMAEVRACVAEWDDEHQAIFLGRLSNQAVYEFYQRNPVDMFINLSESEGVPVSIMEALAHGVPVVATDAGGTSEIVDGEVGRLVPIDVTCSQVCHEITELRSLESAGADLRSAARLRAERLCSSRKNYTEFCERLLVD